MRRTDVSRALTPKILSLLPLKISPDILCGRRKGILAGEASSAVRQAANHLSKPLYPQISQGIGPYHLADLLHAPVVGKKLFSGRHIRPEIAGTAAN